MHRACAGAVWLSVRGSSLDPLPVSGLGGGGSQLVLGRVALASSSVCMASVAANADFGGQMRLLGYRLASDRVTLCWSAEAAMAVDYTVFVHIFDAQGKSLGAADGQPRGGLYPTSAWLPGDLVTDEHPLFLPAGASVRVGVYRLDTGERLSLEGGAETELNLTP